MSEVRPEDDIEELGLGYSLEWLLRNDGINTVEDLAKRTRPGILLIRRIGPTKLAAIRQRMALHGYRFADEDEPKEVVSKRTNPTHALVEQLSSRYDEHEAGVLADWCEERGLVGAARDLRGGPSAACRAQVEALAATMGLRPPETLIYWRRGWCPALVPEEEEADEEKRRSA